MEKKERSLAKAVVYKTGSVIVLALISWLATGNLMQMSVITISYEVIAIIGYFIHERIWAGIKWGTE